MLQNLIRFYVYVCLNLECVVEYMPSKVKHLIVKKQKKDSSASCVVKARCVGLFICVHEIMCCM